MDVMINTTKAHDLVDAVAKSYNLKTVGNCEEVKLEFPKEVGEGYLSAVKFPNGFSLLLFNGKLNKRLNIKTEGDFVHSVYINLSTQGAVKHSFCSDDVEYNLAAMWGSISSCPRHYWQRFVLPPKEPLTFLSIQINRKEFNDYLECQLKGFNARLREVFTDLDGEKTFLYEGAINAAITKVAAELVHHQKEGLISTVYTQSKVLLMFSQFLEWYEKNHSDYAPRVMLKRHDLEIIVKARNYLISDLQNAPTIIQLAREVGINQQKLKSNFKQVFNKTINNYLRDVRLEMARKLLALGDKSVKEVSVEVGYVNQSHFSNRFREKYGMLPKDYMKSQESTLPDIKAKA